MYLNGHPQFVSLGLGRQSTALAILNAEEKIANPTRKLIFADTGSERPETYEFLELHFKDYCKKVGLDLTIVKRSDYWKGEHNQSLEKACLHRKMLPNSIDRWCTGDFKLKPIDKYLSDMGWTGATYAIHQVGIATDEAHRARDLPEKRYPLLELNFNTQMCIEIIKKAGLPIPKKSGCWFCLYAKANEFIALDNEHPDLSNRAVAMERNAIATKNAAFIICGKAISNILFGTNYKLPDYLKEPQKGKKLVLNGLHQFVTSEEVQEFYSHHPKARKNLPIWGNLENLYLQSRNQLGFEVMLPDWFDTVVQEDMGCPSVQSCMT